MMKNKNHKTLEKHNSPRIGQNEEFNVFLESPDQRECSDIKTGGIETKLNVVKKEQVKTN